MYSIGVDFHKAYSHEDSQPSHSPAAAAATWVRSRDMSCQTRTPATPESAATGHISGLLPGRASRFG